jgi:hypothetical protein
MKNNKVSIDLDLEDLFGLKENTNTLEYDLNFIIDNGIDKYLEKQQEEKTKDKEFMELFKRNYNNIVKFIEMDGRIAVNCYTCIKGMDLSKKYGKPKK